MKLYYTMGINSNPGGNNYAHTMTCYFFKTEEEAKEKEEFLQGYGDETEIGSFNGSKGWLVAWGTAFDDVRIEPMAEAKAKKLCADWTTLSMALDVEGGEDEESRAFYFKKFTPDSYCTTSVDASAGRGFKWQFDDYSEEIRESVKTTFKYVPTFESFMGGLQKLNETLDSSWDESREGEPTPADEKKWAPVLKAFKVRKMEDLTWLAQAIPDSDDFHNNSKVVKSFKLKSTGDGGYEWQDPHGKVDFDILEYKGLLIGDHSDEMRYQGTLVRTKDVKAWEAIYKEEGSEGYLY